MTTAKKLWIAIGILVLLSPLGLLVPKWFGAGGAWGEWGVEEIRKMIGSVPQGMAKVSRLWKSPLQNYAIPGGNGGHAHGSLEYILAAVIGVAFTAGVAYFLAKLLGRRNREG